MPLREWNRTSERYPPEGQVVTVLNGHVEQELIFERGMWWLPDRSMYVYFVPSLWRHNDGEAGA
jgi:hypothetical protein